MYEFIAPSYNKLHGLEQERKLKSLLSRISIPSETTVLDVGCATAHLSKYFTKQKYLGVDPCKELLFLAPKNTKVICAFGEQLPFPDKFADYTISLTALHNYKDPIKGFDELIRVTKKTLLVGVLKKAPCHNKIVDYITKKTPDNIIINDYHDTLLIVKLKSQ